MKAPVSFDNFPTFAANGSRDMNPESAKYSVGFVPADTFPAEWANYMFHGATKGVSDLNTAVASIWAENANVLTQAGITPAAENNGQLYSAIMKFINDAVLTANQQVLAQAKLDAHPVGSLYWSSSPTDPATLFGGTWTRIKDRFVLAAGDTYANGATGGSATVQLTESNLPAHSHTWTFNKQDITTSTESNFHTHNFSWSGNHSHRISRATLSGGYSSGEYGIRGGDSYNEKGRWEAEQIYTNQAEISINKDTSNNTALHTHSLSVESQTSSTTLTGSNSAHENMPPYIVKFCWERTA